MKIKELPSPRGARTLVTELTGAAKKMVAQEAKAAKAMRRAALKTFPLEELWLDSSEQHFMKEAVEGLNPTRPYPTQNVLSEPAEEEVVDIAAFNRTFISRFPLERLWFHGPDDQQTLLTHQNQDLD